MEGGRRDKNQLKQGDLPMSDTGAFVYLVDDDVSAREGVARLVRSAGLMAKTFSSGDGFLAALRTKLPSCLVLDMVFLAIGWGLSRLRVYQIAREFDARLEGRLDERMRVARELHDTILQSFQASLVQMQAARNLFSRRPDQAAQNLDRAINMAADAIAEGRDAIQELRCQAADRGDMEKLLTETGQELARSQELGEHPVRFRVVVEGQRQQLEPLVQVEIYQIARELLRNAFRHAQASQVEAEIRYQRRLFCVHVRDNGKGIEPEVLQAGGRDGHWGLTGICERTKRIGARLDFWSKRGAGTEVRLTVPALISYAAGERGRRFQL
jgi:signal transduction histidine kinase